MSEHDFSEEIKEAARRLVYEPSDPATLTRLRARVLATVEKPRSVVGFFDRYFRMIAAALVVTIGVGIGTLLATTTDPLEELGTSAQLLLAEGDLYGVE